MTNFVKRTSALTGALLLMSGAAMADQVIADDLIVQGSICVGMDCVNGESFGFDTLRLKENNLRIKAQDTSASASFPTVDWQLTFNDSANGGANKFSIDNIDRGTTPFTILDGAPSNSLYVDAQGDVGVGTSNAVVELHVVDGDSPTLRLEQNGSSGFTPQTWDIASNETNFFLRDVTNGSRLPFRVEPSTPGDTLYLDSTGNIGMGTNTPDAELHIRRSDASSTRLLLENTNAADQAVQIRLISNSDDNRRIIGQDSSGTQETQISLNSDHIILAGPNVQGANLWARIDATGITTNGPSCSSAPCDRTFDPDYFTVPEIEAHANYMWGNRHLQAVGPTEAGKPFNLLEKSAGMLHELELAHIYIEQLHTRLASLETALQQK